jgi:hypothetical protein
MTEQAPIIALALLLALDCALRVAQLLRRRDRRSWELSITLQDETRLPSSGGRLRQVEATGELRRLEPYQPRE